MPNPISMELQPKQNQKQIQRLMMTPQMQQAIHLLQLPILELAQTIEQEMEQNPVLEQIEEEAEEEEEAEGEEEEVPDKEMEFDEHQFEILRQLDDDFRDLFSQSETFIPLRSSEEEKRKVFLESMVQEQPTLADHLMAQAREQFSDPQELKTAEIIIGHIDSNGLLATTPQEIAAYFSLDVKQIEKVIRQIQTFDPPGIAACDVRQALLNQIQAKGQEHSIAYQIINLHYDDFLHNRLPVIQKALKTPIAAIREAIKNVISGLNLHPGIAYSKKETMQLVPDIQLRQDGDELVVDISDEQLKPLRLNRKYLQMLEDETLPSETKDFIRSKILSAKWLMKNVSQRQSTLERIAESLIKHQKHFFTEPQGKLKPLIMKELADELNVHESTIARAVANKYIDTPRGLLPLRYFFSNAYVSKQGLSTSSKTVREMIQKLIDKEDKKSPISDEAISRRLTALGVPCARRTVAKYRAELEIGNTQQRRHY